jgi:hypothetical protein
MEKKDNVNRIPTVSRVVGDTIVELVYDAENKRTGLIVSRFGGLWNVEQEFRTPGGEILVPYSPANNLIANACVYLPSLPEHHGDKQTLLSNIEAFIHRYVDFSPAFERIAAHYILLTWVHDAFGDLPYLRLRGDYGTGKTRGLLVLGSLCYKAFFASGASTTSPIFHTLDNFGGTLILDEADFRFSDKTSELVKILNNGTTRGLPVLRTMQNRDKEFNPRAFKVFGPKLIGMRGYFGDAALESRFLTEETGGRALRADIPIHLPDSFGAEALELRNQLLHFRLCNLFHVKADPTRIPAGLEPRLKQTSLSLLSLIDDAGLRGEVAGTLSSYNDTLRARHRAALEFRVIAAVRDAFARPGVTAVSIKDILQRLKEDGWDDAADGISNKLVGSILRTRFDIATRKSHGVFVIPASEKEKIEALAAKFVLDTAEMPTVDSAQ